MKKVNHYIIPIFANSLFMESKDQMNHFSHFHFSVVWLEFLNDDGSFATGVTSDGSQIPESPYFLIDTQTFDYGGSSIKIIL